MAQFKMNARAVEMLGKNQIADLPTAITELWKNGYDAYGDKLGAYLYLPKNDDVYAPMFSISDDGYGMNRSDIETKWMVLGTEFKKHKPVILEEDKFNKPDRIPIGEKGIGRLSVAYLGNQMLLISKKKNKQYMLLFMNWAILENGKLFLDDIEIPMNEIENLDKLDDAYKDLVCQYVSNIKETIKDSKWDMHEDLLVEILATLYRYDRIPNFIINHFKGLFNESDMNVGEADKHGTCFLIFDPIDEIVRAGDTKEKKNDTDIESDQYLISALSGLFNPLDLKVKEARQLVLGEEYLQYPCWYIFYPDGTRIDYLKSKGEFFTVDEFENCEHWIKGKFDKEGHFIGEIKVYGKIIPDYRFEPRTNNQRLQCGEFELCVAFWEGDSKNSMHSREELNIYNHKAELFSGLYIYRDGFRVLPYGRTDFDFLDFEKRRSLNAGRYYFSHRKMIGFISIGKHSNPYLIDKAGREGLISNMAYRQLKNMLKEFFIDVADSYYGKKSESRKVALEEKKRRDIETRLLKDDEEKQRVYIRQLLRTILSYKTKLNRLIEKTTVLEQDVDQKSLREIVPDNQEWDIYERYKDIENELQQLQINISPTLNLKSDDDAFDLYWEYKEEYEGVCKRAKLLQTEIIERTPMNAHLEYYRQQWEETYSYIFECRRNYLKRLSQKELEIQKATVDSFVPFQIKIDSYAPDIIKTLGISEEKIIDKMHELDYLKSSFQEKTLTVLDNFYDYFESLQINGDQVNLIGAYRNVNDRLKRESERIFELAQVGMAIEQQDHQFNSLYSKIRETMNDLEKIVNNPLEKDKIHTLEMTIEHLEDNYKKLEPLYRVSRKERKSISGLSIEKTILSFYGEKIEKKKIVFVCEKAFRDHIIFSYESIIVPVFLNIIDNAIYWLEKVPERKIIIFLSETGDIVIANSGEKMSISETTKCFDVFYTKKPAGRGIGLYLAKTTLRSIGMDIYSTQEPSYNIFNGACFVITDEIIGD